MSDQVVKVEWSNWDKAVFDPKLTVALEAGKVLHFPNLGVHIGAEVRHLLSSSLLVKGVRNISLSADDDLKGLQATPEVHAKVKTMMTNFRERAKGLIGSLVPEYMAHLRIAPVSLRPTKVEDRVQSWRADDKRLHVDSFPSRPNRGERILRVFVNLNHEGLPRVWRVGEAFEQVALQLLPRVKPYSRSIARLLNALKITKTLRSEYDHTMLQLHDLMKADLNYQKACGQSIVKFEPGSVWVCFSDQTSHAVMSGQHMMELTAHIGPEHQYDPSSSPLAVLQRLRGRSLV